MYSKWTALFLQFPVVNRIERKPQAPKDRTGRTTLTTDKHYRSLAKAVSWRITGTVDTVIISYLITGRIRWALSIGLVELFTKITLYYLHERLWNKFSFGRKPIAGDYEI